MDKDYFWHKFLESSLNFNELIIVFIIYKIILNLSYFKLILKLNNKISHYDKHLNGPHMEYIILHISILSNEEVFSKVILFLFSQILKFI